VRVLGHLAALIGVKEDIVDVKGSSNKRLLVGSRNGNSTVTGSTSKGAYSPQALTNGAEINVDLDLVVLKGNKRKSKSRVAAKPEKKRDVKGGLRKSLARSTYLGRTSSRSTGSADISEGRIGDVGKLGGVTDHLEVTTLLFSRHGKLVPDVHPVTVLTVDALATNLNLNLGNKLLTREI
jgi:pSer/pThr/pTyr-binding forkhead associated (FHA) protein